MQRLLLTIRTFEKALTVHRAPTDNLLSRGWTLPLDLKMCNDSPKQSHNAADPYEDKSQKKAESFSHCHGN